MTTATLRQRKARVMVKRLGFARSIETSVDGEAPEAARLWKAGWNKTDKGDLNFTAKSARLVLKAYEARGNPLAWYYEHEDRIPIEQRGGAPMKGVCSAPSSDLAVRPTDAGPDLWAEHIAWTAEARRQIISGERRQLSPIAAYDEDTREIVEILNVSLCAEGATHFGTILASAGSGKAQALNMDELLQQLTDAIEAGDWDLVGQLCQQLEATDGGAMIAKMVRAALKAIKGSGEDKAEPPDDTAMKKLAAALAAGRPASGNANVQAFTREIEAQRTGLLAATRRAEAAVHEAKLGRVEGLIAANRSAFDAVDEREHLAAADPDRTRKHIASFTRKEEQRAAGQGGSADGKTVLTAGRGETRPPKGAKPEDDTHGLTAVELHTAGQHNVDPKAFAASKARLAKNGRS